jgi:hypothetical protein
MDIKDGFTTSSKEYFQSVVRVHEPDEITSNCGEDWSATKEHPGDWSIKHQTSCMENLHLGREDDIVKIMQVEGAKCINAWGPTGAKGWPNRVEVGLAWSGGRFAPLLAPEGFSTLKSWRRRHSQGRDPFAPGGHPQAREREEGDLRRGIDHLEGSTHKWRRRKTLSEGWPWSTVLCLAPWWGNLLICPWVVIDLEYVIVPCWNMYLSSCVECA